MIMERLKVLVAVQQGQPMFNTPGRDDAISGFVFRLPE
jgi:hypothetical protein